MMSFNTSNNTSPEEPGNGNKRTTKRWYDRDPDLSHAIAQLEQADSVYQAQVALNIIKIMVEHEIEATATNDNISLDPAQHWTETCKPYPLRRRWYDVNETVRSAMAMLEDCPEELQATLLPQIVAMVENTLSKPA
jgi:hypothetical protein